MIAVPTPLSEGIPDLSYVQESARALAVHVTRGCTVILESTTYPGTTEEVPGPLLEEGSGLRAPGLFPRLGFQRFGADVAAVDPFADPFLLPPGIGLTDLASRELAAADAVVILTDHDTFDYEQVARTAQYISDTRNRCRGPRVERL